MNKRNIYTVLTTLLLILISNGVQAQKLSSMTVNERDSKLIEIGKTVYKQYPEFYREYGTPQIITKTIPLLNVEQMELIDKAPSSPWKWAVGGETYYIVEFPYDATVDLFQMNYAAQVYIRDDQVAFAIAFGDGIRKCFDMPYVQKYRIKYSGNFNGQENIRYFAKKDDIFAVTVVFIDVDNQLGKVNISVTNGFPIDNKPTYNRKLMCNDAVDGDVYEVYCTYKVKCEGKGDITININKK